MKNDFMHLRTHDHTKKTLKDEAKRKGYESLTEFILKCLELFYKRVPAKKEF